MIAKEKKQAIIAEYGRTPGDTGSPEVQVAILSARIAELTEHLKGSPFKTWYVKDDRSETWITCIPQRDRYREISFTYRAFRSQKVIVYLERSIYIPLYLCLYKQIVYKKMTESIPRPLKSI